MHKDTVQNPGGITSFSLKPAIVQRYCLTAEYRSAFLGQLRNMVQASNAETQHTELQSSRIKNDEQAVSSIVDLIQGGVNLFSESQSIILKADRSLFGKMIEEQSLQMDAILSHPLGPIPWALHCQIQMAF